LECEDAGIGVLVLWLEIEESLFSYIFLDDAVISLEALMIRSLRSWCSSSSARKPSNMDMIGDEIGALALALVSCSAMAAWGLLTPICIIEDGLDEMKFNGC
jgi:hypothetical protein